MYTLTVDPKSFGIIRRNSKRFQLRFRAASNKAAYRGAAVLWNAVRENMSRDDYTLRELAEKDHPYAKRHGRILTGRLGIQFNIKPYMIHERSGRLKKDLRIRLNRSKGEAKVFFAGTVPYMETVIKGTQVSKLIPRDVISGTAGEKKVQREMRKEMIIPLKGVIKSYGR